MKRIGLGVTGSFCTFSNLLTALDDLTANGYDVTPVFSYNTAKLDTRFFKAADFYAKVTEKTGKRPITSIVDAEPVGTSMGLELMLVAPCTATRLRKSRTG